MVLNSEIIKNAQIIWDYMQMGHTVAPADFILVLGSNDVRLPEYAAELVMADVAPAVIFSGGIAHLDDLLATGWEMTEAEMFGQIAQAKGVAAEKIILEKEAQNTSKNFRFSLPLARAHGLKTDRVLIVCKPYMQRRAMATAAVEWASEPINYTVVSPPGNFTNYFANEAEAEKHLHLMVGDLQRIAHYPGLGIQATQEIPNEVVYAFNTLVELGFDKHLLKDRPRILLS